MANSYTNTALLDRNRPRKVVFYGRVSTEHEAQLSALGNQMEWYEDIAKRFPNWTVVDKYIDEGITGTQARKRPSFMRMIKDSKTDKFDLIVTREVCRFARNTVDTLTYTRELSNIGVEVYFVDDNIWTLESDGELRLSIMATLAQEESRKVSDRVKAGQAISRQKGTLYGCGNILGYDLKRNIDEKGNWNPSENTYVINPEQAETVRMIFDLYEKGYGCMKIANILTERHRKNATGNVRWGYGNLIRIISNATYKGMICYNKSRSSNYLEQKRIVNHDRDTYVYEKGNFEPIISEEQWDKCNAILKSRRTVIGKDAKGNDIVNGVCPSADLWSNKLKCTCGAKFRKNVYHKNNDGSHTYCYLCYNQVNNGKAKKRAAAGLDTDGYCDNKLVLQWRMDMMSEFLIDEIWKNKNSDIETALGYIQKYFVADKPVAKTDDKAAIDMKIEALQQKINQLIMMRTEGEITKDELANLRSQLDNEIAELTKQKNAIPETSEQIVSDKPDIAKIRATLESIGGNPSEPLSKDFLNGVIDTVIPNGDGVYEWNINFGHTKETVKLVAVGDKRSKKERPYVHLYGQEAEKSASALHNKNAVITVVRYDFIATQLHRLLLNKSRRTPFYTKTISFDEAKAFRKAHGSYLRANQWNDLTVDVYLEY